MSSSESIALGHDENIAYLGIRNYGFDVIDITSINDMKVLFSVKTGACEVIFINIFYIFILLKN